MGEVGRLRERRVDPRGGGEGWRSLHHTRHCTGKEREIRVPAGQLCSSKCAENFGWPTRGPGHKSLSAQTPKLAWPGPALDSGAGPQETPTGAGIWRLRSKLLDVNKTLPDCSEYRAIRSTAYQRTSARMSSQRRRLPGTKRRAS